MTRPGAAKAVSPQAVRAADGHISAARDLPDGNPENPNCNEGSPTSYSGGTGWFYSNSFISDYVGAPFTGAADVPDADFTNIFLYPDSSTMTWDEYMASLPSTERGPTQEQIDAMTQALVCSSYFDDLSQYNINPPIYSGDEKTITSCVSAALHDANADNGGVIVYATMRTFAGCEQSNNANGSSQVNIFTAYGINTSAYGHDGTSMCSTGVLGYHGWGLSVPNWTVIPTNPSCNYGAGHVLDVLSHEMVETVSDPGGFGWIHTEDDLNVTQNTTCGELGDICSGVGMFPTPASSPGYIPFPDTPALTALGLSNLFVSPYYSDQEAQCEPTAIMNDTVVPLAGSPSIRFTGSVHNLVVQIGQPSSPPGTLDALELDIANGQRQPRRFFGGELARRGRHRRRYRHPATGRYQRGCRVGQRLDARGFVQVPARDHAQRNKADHSQHPIRRAAIRRQLGCLRGDGAGCDLPEKQMPRGPATSPNIVGTATFKRREHRISPYQGWRPRRGARDIRGSARVGTGPTGDRALPAGNNGG